MNAATLLISTPDLRATPTAQLLRASFASAFCPALSAKSTVNGNSLDAKIADLNQGMAFVSAKTVGTNELAHTRLSAFRAHLKKL